MFNKSAVHAHQRKEEKIWQGKGRKGKKRMERKGREENKKSNLFKPSLKMDWFKVQKFLKPL